MAEENPGTTLKVERRAPRVTTASRLELGEHDALAYPTAWLKTDVHRQESWALKKLWNSVGQLVSQVLKPRSPGVK